MAGDGLHVAMRQGDWKILADEKLTRFELYDLKTDPAESKHRAATDVETFDALKKRLLSLNAEIEAEGPDWWRRLSASGGRAGKR